MLNEIIATVDKGHIGSELDATNEPTKNSVCKLDGEPFPCFAVRSARSIHARNLLMQEKTKQDSLKIARSL